MTTSRRIVPHGVTGTLTSALTGVLATALLTGLLAGCTGPAQKAGDASASPAASSPAGVSTESPTTTAAPTGTPTDAPTGTPTQTPAETPAATPGFNNADVMFARMMIPHHLQAIDMATLAQTRAGDQWVRDMADKILEAQDPEIRTLKSWLDKWGAEPLPRDHRMPGMQTAADIAKLAKAEGPAFDRLFVTMMIEHHGGAVQIAEVEQAKGADPDAKAMAESMAATQRAEVKEMKKYLPKLK
ncbi:DUF305 domain-containing protein [Planotetraspora sp. GP83]|uniref:DUF305 domain-containing protein n=1 Tax=Planotetraspora sp. GP83 TaxID=3156264 RepID=UPI00351630A1